LLRLRPVPLRFPAARRTCILPLGSDPVKRTFGPFFRPPLQPSSDFRVGRPVSGQTKTRSNLIGRSPGISGLFSDIACRETRTPVVCSSGKGLFRSLPRSAVELYHSVWTLSRTSFRGFFGGPSGLFRPHQPPSRVPSRTKNQAQSHRLDAWDIVASAPALPAGKPQPLTVLLALRSASIRCPAALWNYTSPRVGRQGVLASTF
jgi:hypothetical protein